MNEEKPWSKRKRERLLARARFLDQWAQRIRAKVKAHTPKRTMKKPRLMSVA